MAKSKRPRDSYRARVFAAEDNTSNRALASAEIDALIRRVNGSAWAAKNVVHPVYRWSWWKCTAWDHTAGALPMGNGPALNDLRFFHGLAHHMVADDVALHGPEFVRAYIEAVRKFLGEARSEELREQMKKSGAKMRSWSPEAREKARERYHERHFHSAVHELKAMLEELNGEPDG